MISGGMPCTMNIACQFQFAINQPAVGAMMIEETGRAISEKLMARPRSESGYQLTKTTAKDGHTAPSANPMMNRTASSES